MEQEIVEGFRLSPQQRHLWRAQAAGSAAAFRVRALVRLDGAVDAQRLGAAATQLVEQNEVLRTVFGTLPGVVLPVQVIAASLPPRYEHKSGDRAAAQDALDSLAQRSFDLERGPLLDLTLVQESNALSWLVLGLPALCCDAAGLEALLEQLLRLYGGEAAPAPASEEDEDGPLQYADLSEWQNELLESDDSSEQVEAWRARGASGQPSFDLGFLSRVGALDSTEFRPAVVAVPLPAELIGALAELAGKLGTTPDRVHLAAWQTLLARMSGQGELLLGLRGDGRNHDELRGALGLFSRDLPLACTLEDEATFEGLVAAAASAADLALASQEYCSWEHMTGGELGFYPVSFAHEPRREVTVAGAPRATLEALLAHALRFELRLVSTGAGLLELHYDQASRSTAEVETLAGRLVTLLAAAATRPSTAAAELALMDAAETERAGAGLCGPAPADAPDLEGACIHDLIQRAGSADPEAPAAIDADETLTYGELERRSNQLANYLRAAGVGPDVRVGLCLDRSTRMLVAILGVLKAGGAYVPIDPSYPAERRAFMARDAQVPVCLAESSVAVGEADFADARVIHLDRDWHEIAAAGDDLPEAGVGPQHLAYVIYTSGSTGTPKGVEITHRNLVHSTSARFSFYDNAPARYLLLSSFAFDSSVAGIFWTLTQGGTLVLPRSGDEKEVALLGELIERHGVTTMLALPSLFGLVLDHVDAAKLASLETVIVAGEACPRDLASRCREQLAGARLFNEYGPTEASVWCTAMECTDLDPERPVPIGRPIASTYVRLLDARGGAVPPGAPGELHVGGPGLARGYLDRSDLTAERFIADPCAADADARLYRTGDLVRLLPGGELEFLGRIDQQVKLRGYRIELGEIEDAISASAGVREVVVVARSDAGGDTRLVAYVVGGGDTETLAADLRVRLPEYMVPAAFVHLDDLPRTPNGKVDRKALPEPDGGRPSISTEYVAPEGALEHAVAQVWTEVLGIEPVGVDDDFFELGGHSIMAVRLLARMNETLQVDVHLKVLFDAPTVRGLLAALCEDPAEAARLAKTADLLAQIAALSEDELDTALGERDGA